MPDPDPNRHPLSHRDADDMVEDAVVWITPFGWVCEWELSVYGKSLAKVFKSL